MDEITLWKAPQRGRNADYEVKEGFDPTDYPGNGPYFALDRNLAEEWQKVYENGIQEIHLLRSHFAELVRQGVILEDSYYPDQSCHVPPAGLPAFNEAIKQGTPNIYYPQFKGLKNG